MEQVADAPWIREAENDGMPDNGEAPECPIYGHRCRTIYMDSYGDPIGCNECITAVDADDWYENGGYK